MATASYREWPAHAALTDTVTCVWVSAVSNQPTPPQDRVLPDGCIDIIWDGLSLFVAGPDTGPKPLDDRSARFFSGVRFRTGRACQFLRISAAELVDQRVAISELWGREASASLSNRLEAAPSPPAAAHVLECALLARRPEAAEPDPVVDDLVAQLRARGTTAADPSRHPVAQISRRLGVSERELLRRCRAGVGYGPKSLDRIMRFQRARSLATTTLTLADLAANSGYADQAHLARECRMLAGLTPTELFKTAARPQS